MFLLVVVLMCLGRLVFIYKYEYKLNYPNDFPFTQLRADLKHAAVICADSAVALNPQVGDRRQILSLFSYLCSQVWKRSQQKSQILPEV